MVITGFNLPATTAMVSPGAVDAAAEADGLGRLIRTLRTWETL